MRDLLANALARGARHAEVHASIGALKSVRFQNGRWVCREGENRRFRLRVASRNRIGLATDSRFSSRLVDAALQAAAQGPPHRGFINARRYTPVPDIEDPDIGRWTIDAMLECMKDMIDPFDPAIPIIELATEYENIRLANTEDLNGEYAHSLARLVVSCTRPSCQPVTLFWRRRPDKTTLAEYVIPYLQPDIPEAPSSISGSHDAYFSPHAASKLFELYFSKWVDGTANPLPDAVSVVDDATVPGGIGSRPFDDVGYASQRRVLVEKGRPTKLPPHGEGFHFISDAGHTLLGWNNIKIEGRCEKLAMSGLVVDRLELLGDALMATVFQCENGAAVQAWPSAMIREPATAILSRIAAIGNDPNMTDSVAAPSLFVENVPFEPSPFAM